MAKGIYTGLTTDPIGFGKELGKSLLDWDTWADDPARAIGHLVPDAIVAVATAGTGALATRGAKGGARRDRRAGRPQPPRQPGRPRQARPLRRADRPPRLDDLPDDLRDLVNKPIGDLTPGEIDRLVEARDAIKVEPGTPMQRVIPQNMVDDYLRGSSSDPHFKPDQTFGFTSRDDDVDQLRTPREMYDKLGLDYQLRRHAPLHPRPVDDIHVLRYDADRPQRPQRPPALRPRRRRRLGPRARSIPSNPFTGNGYTSGGIPEFRTDDATDLPDGVADLADGQLGRPAPGARCSPTTWAADAAMPVQ